MSKYLIDYLKEISETLKGIKKIMEGKENADDKQTDKKRGRPKKQSDENDGRQGVEDKTVQHNTVEKGTGDTP